MLHLAHPRPVPWRTIISPLSTALSLPIVPYAEWCSLLEASSPHHNHDHHINSNGNADADSEVELMRQNPALKILEFFLDARAKMSLPKNGSPEAMGLPMLDVAHALEAAPSLREETLPQLSADDVERWIGYWRRVGAIA